MEYKVLDREFRDYTEELKYPFSDNAVMGASDGMAMPSDVFLDILLYVSGNYELPFFLSSIRQTATGTVIEIKDNSDNTVAECPLDLSKDYSTFFSSGMEAGTVVYSPDSIKQLVRTSSKGAVLFGRNLPIQTGRCFTYEPNALTGVRTQNGELKREEVHIVAAGGVSFAESDGTVYINLYGEDPDDANVTSVNGISRKQLWFAAHPNSGVKIETDDSGIKFRSIIDE